MGKQRIECFFVVPGVTAEESFRRYVGSDKMKCPLPHGYHDASVVLGEVPWGESYHGCGDIPDETTKADPRWPTACACGYVFQPTDTWQHNFKRHFVDEATGRKFLLHDAPPGAMWNADWMHRFERTTADGLWLCVRLPNGIDWLIDGPSRNTDDTLGPGWTRTGTPPKITARPSIFANQGHPDAWHGFLTDGWLEEC